MSDIPPPTEGDMKWDYQWWYRKDLDQDNPPQELLVRNGLIRRLAAAELTIKELLDINEQLAARWRVCKKELAAKTK